MYGMLKSNIIRTCLRTIRSYIFYSERLDPVLGLRGLACLVVIWDHLQRINGWIMIHGIDLSFIVAPDGGIAVPIFYLISGFSVGYGFFSKKYTLSIKSLRSYYINRWLRIAPAYYVCMLACIFIFYRQTAVSLHYIVRFFTFTANFDYLTLPIQQLLAILSTEMQFYLIAPLLFAALSRIVHKIHPLVVGMYILCFGCAVRYLLLTLGLVASFDMFRLNVYVTVWGMIDYFLFGMFLSYIICERKADVIALKKRIPNAGYVILLISLYLWINYNIHFAMFIPWSKDVINRMFILPPSLCILIGWYIISRSVVFTYRRIQYSVSRIVKLLIHPRTFFYGIGFISYGLYLYHYVFFDLLYLKPGFVNSSTPSFSRFFVVLSITIITAIASYTLIESPFLRKKHKTV